MEMLIITNVANALSLTIAFYAYNMTLREKLARSERICNGSRIWITGFIKHNGGELTLPSDFNKIVSDNDYVQYKHNADTNTDTFFVTRKGE